MSSDNDYYRVLQVNRSADSETIHRVYRIMAARFHPDNPRTGNTEAFLELKRAYEVLSDDVKRTEYDNTRVVEEQEPNPIFELEDFVYGLRGEVNRRLGVLALLYNRRRANEDQPSLSVLDLERLMAFPRERLNFTLWYLKGKGYVRQEDNSDCGITPEGLDFIEAHACRDELVKALIHAGPNEGDRLPNDTAVKVSSPKDRPTPGSSHSATLALAN